MNASPEPGAPAPLVDAVDVIRLVGPRAFSRAKEYARDDHVLSSAWDVEGQALTAEVRGSVAAPYRCRVVLAPGRGEHGRPTSSECSCPLGGDCKHVAAALLAMGCYEISLGDTIGTGTPREARQLIERVAADVPIDRLALHFHDTYGMATANVYACLELGISSFDSSIAGLGGCPYAKGATGNVATEDVLYLLSGLGIETGIDFTKAVATGQWISGILDRKAHSRAGNAVTAKLAA